MTRILVLIVILALAVPAVAQHDALKAGESFSIKVIRPGGETQELSVAVTPRGKIGVIRPPSLKPTKLQRPIVAALAFLVRWGKGQMTIPPGKHGKFDPATPVTIRGQHYTAGGVKVVLPIVGLEMISGQSAVLVRRIRLIPIDQSPVYQGAARLHYATAADGWVTITGVEAP